MVKFCETLDETTRNSTHNITSAHNYVVINYYDTSPDEESEGTVNFGFELEYKTVNPKCGGLLEDVTHGKWFWLFCSFLEFKNLTQNFNLKIRLNK